MKKPSHTQVFWIALVAASVLAAVVSLMIGLKQSVWFDEAYSILLAERSFGEIVSLTSQDVHPPVYYWLLKVWMLLFGSSELALRGLSALFLGLSVGTAGLLLRRTLGRRIALIALPFVAFAPFLLRYGFEIRMYAFVSFVGIFATYILVVATETADKRKRRLLLAGYALLVALGVYTLYFMALVWLAHLAWLVVLARKSKSISLLVEGVVAYLASFVLFIPWLPVFLGKASGSTLSPVTSQLDLSHLLGIVTFTFLYHPERDLGVLYGILAVLIVVSVGVLGAYAFKRADHRRRLYLTLLGGYSMIPIAVLVVVTAFAPIYLERYIAHIIIGGYMFVGVAVAVGAESKNRWLAAPIGVLVFAFIAGNMSLVNYGNYNFQRASKPVVNQVASYIDCSEDAVVFADDPMIAIEMHYYVKACPIRFASSSYDMGGGYAPLSESPFRTTEPWIDLKDASKIYYVYYDNPKLAMPSNFTLVDTHTPGNMAVAIYAP